MIRLEFQKVITRIARAASMIKESPYKVCDIVAFQPPLLTGRFGVITRVYHYPRSGFVNRFRSQTLHNVHFLNERGVPMACPACDGKDQHCPVHSRAVWEEQIQPLSERDLTYYMKNGFIAPPLVALMRNGLPESGECPGVLRLVH